MARSLHRLLHPQSLAVFGGSWAEAVITQCQRMGFAGDIWPVHPTRDTVAGLPCFRDVAALPGAPDASFVGVNRHATLEVVAQLAARGAGGAVCFASGFAEAAAESPDGPALQRELVQAAGAMPVLGPNCYGLINYVDGALLWPDQHGGDRVTRGVGLITQSSNIAINLSMQQRGLPVAFVATAGNQAQTGLAALAEALIDDDRVTALGLYIEGIGDPVAFERMAQRAHAAGKAIVALKVGKSSLAQAGMVSHTNSLAGSDAGAAALLRRCGVARVDTVSALIETLKLVHTVGPLASTQLSSMSCSGGEASLIADTAEGREPGFPALTAQQHSDLRAALGDAVALANPLDYHTYIWHDEDALAACYAGMLRGDAALNLLVMDIPREDRCDTSTWAPALNAIRRAQRDTGAPTALLASLPENLPETLAGELMVDGIVPLCGFDDALVAVEAAAAIGAHRAAPQPTPLWPPAQPTDATATKTLTEADAKQALSRVGVRVPRSVSADSVDACVAAAAELGFPVVVKGQGIAHKSDAGAVHLGLATADAVATAARQTLGVAPSLLVEEQITEVIAELLVGVVTDPAHGYVLTLAAGGTLTEVLRDSTSLLLPASDDAIRAALGTLKIHPLLGGFRGRPAADTDAIVAQVQAVCALVEAERGTLAEVEINPVLCRAHDAVAADALLSRWSPA
ncbi:MAG: acetate--CoA ligase family protein [Pseudomonadota bacterium]